jgi:Na+-driven multidrug efflux pump
MFVSNGVVNGAGQTLVTMMFSLIALWIVRVPLAAYLLHHTSVGIKGIWIAMTASFAVTSCISFFYYLSGRWKKASLKIQMPIENPPQPVLEP